MTASKPALVVAFYANPDRYPPTYNAVRLLGEHFRVRVVCRNNADAPGMVWPDDVRIDRVGPPLADAAKLAASAGAKLREYAGFVAALRRVVAEERPRVIFAYEPHALVAAALTGSRAPVVYQRHEIEELEQLDARSLQSWIIRASLRLTRRAALVIFPEEHRARYNLRFARDPRPPLIVPNFPLRAAFPPLPALGPLVADRLRDKVVFYRGAMGHHAGIPEAVRALAHLPPDVRLRLCGASSPAFTAEIAALAASLGLADRVRNEGFLPSFDALNRETAKAAVGLVLYKPAHENLRHIGSATNKLYEYAACGVPVVATDGPTFRDFLGDEPWMAYADPRDPRSVAAAITELLADAGKYEERCAAARRAFEERLNYEAVFAPVVERVLRLADIG
jgi:glycosyltransferase involved in cell wall biosynthesis